MAKKEAHSLIAHDRKTQSGIMDDNKRQKDNSAKSSWSLGKIEEFFDKNVELAKRELNFLCAVSLITPEDEEAFRAAPIDVVLPKKDRQEDKALKELERERRHEANRACIREFLEIGRELKKSDPKSKLFNMSEELLDCLDRIESDPCSLSKYEWKRLDTQLGTYASLLRGEAKKRCEAPSAKQEKQVELTDTEQNILEALGNDTLRGTELFKRAGYDNSSHYRTILSNLVKREILGRNQDGYYRL